MKSAIKIIHSFRQEEDGLALTEYLILLGVLIGGVITAVTVAGVDLATAWDSWGTWWTTLGANIPPVCCANAQAANVPGNCCN